MGSLRYAAVSQTHESGLTAVLQLTPTSKKPTTHNSCNKKIITTFRTDTGIQIKNGSHAY